MGKKEDRQKYLRNVSKTLQGQLGLSAEQFKECKTFAEIEAALNAKAATIDIRLMQSPDEQIGKLACIANEADVRHLARQALVPAIASRLWAELNPRKVIKCRFCDFTVPKFARGRPGNDFDVMRTHIDDEHPEKADQIATIIFGSRGARDEEEIQAFLDEHST
jgi:hypothetical protein